MKNGRTMPFIAMAAIVIVAVSGYALFRQTYPDRFYAAAEPSVTAPAEWPTAPNNLPAPSPAAGPAKVLYLEVGRPVRIDFDHDIPKSVSTSTSQVEVDGRSVLLTPTAPGFGALQLSNDKGLERWSIAYVAWRNTSEFPDDARLTSAVAGGYAIPVRVKDPTWKGLQARSANPIPWGESIP